MRGNESYFVLYAECVRTKRRREKVTSLRGMTFFAALALLAIVYRAATGSNTDEAIVAVSAVTVDTNDDGASLPDFDGDGTVGFGDFVKFSAKFGLRQGDDGYDP